MPFDPSDPSPIPGLPDTGWPTTNQLAAIGAVVNAWSWLELGVQNLLCRLVQSSPWLSQALTEDLSPDNRLKALRRLAHTWDRTYVNITGHHAALLVEIEAITKWIATNKTKRNNIAHYMWIRSDDETMFGWKHSLAIPRDERARPNLKIKWQELIEFSNEIGAMVGRVDAAEHLVRELPDWPVSWRER